MGYRITLIGLLMLGGVVVADRPKNERTLAEDMKQLEGQWTTQGATVWGSVKSDKTPEFVLGIGTKGNAMTLKDGYLHVGKLKLKVNNDGFETKFSEQIANGNGRNARPIKLTDSDGTSYVAGYELNGNSLVIRYPAGCCSRSGSVISLSKASK